MDEVKYAWTVSIIAQYDEGVKMEYDELEQSILHQKYSKHLQFIIFKYDQITKEASVKIRKRDFLGKQFFQIIQIGKVDFYADENNILVGFFQKYTSPKYKNMIITWGHGAGL